MRANATGLPITLDVEGKVVVLVGVDEAKRELLTEAGAQVRAVSDFAESLLEGASLVMLTAKDAALAERVRAACAKKNVLLWCCDNPSQSDFAMPAIARLGMARIAISTSGASPALAGRVREIVEKALGERFVRFVEVLGALRDRAKQEPDEGKRRAVLQAALDGFDADIAVRYPKWFK